MRNKKICTTIILIFMLTILSVIFFIAKNENKMELGYDIQFLEGNFNLSGIENCVYTQNVVENPRSIGPCDYEYFVFAKINNTEIEKIKKTYKFKQEKPKFGFSPTPNQKSLEDFNDKNILACKDFCWGYSSEFEMNVMKNSSYIGKVYFDTINGYIYMWISTT
jgi:hypothetical protein